MDFILHDIQLAVGVNNLFNIKTPGCVSCDLNNFDPTIYDTPGRYYYARLSVKLGARRRLRRPTRRRRRPRHRSLSRCRPPPPPAAPAPPPPPAATPERGN